MSLECYPKKSRFNVNVRQGQSITQKRKKALQSTSPVLDDGKQKYSLPGLKQDMHVKKGSHSSDTPRQPLSSDLLPNPVIIKTHSKFSPPALPPKRRFCRLEDITECLWDMDYMLVNDSVKVELDPYYLMESARCGNLIEQSYIEDLSEEGVEPNPGPNTIMAKPSLLVVFIFCCNQILTEGFYVFRDFALNSGVLGTTCAATQQITIPTSGNYRVSVTLSTDAIVNNSGLPFFTKFGAEITWNDGTNTQILATGIAGCGSPDGACYNSANIQRVYDLVDRAAATYTINFCNFNTISTALVTSGGSVYVTGYNVGLPSTFPSVQNVSVVSVDIGSGSPNGPINAFVVNLPLNITTGGVITSPSNLNPTTSDVNVVNPVTVGGTVSISSGTVTVNGAVGILGTALVAGAVAVTGGIIDVQNTPLIPLFVTNPPLVPMSVETELVAPRFHVTNVVDVNLDSVNPLFVDSNDGGINIHVANGIADAIPTVVKNTIGDPVQTQVTNFPTGLQQVNVTNSLLFVETQNPVTVTGSLSVSVDNFPDNVNVTVTNFPASSNNVTVTNFPPVAPVEIPLLSIGAKAYDGRHVEMYIWETDQTSTVAPLLEQSANSEVDVAIFEETDPAQKKKRQFIEMWSKSSKLTNKEMHALNGNTSMRKMSVNKRDKLIKGSLLEDDYQVVLSGPYVGGLRLSTIFKNYDVHNLWEVLWLCDDESVVADINKGVLFDSALSDEISSESLNALSNDEGRVYGDFGPKDTLGRQSTYNDAGKSKREKGAKDQESKGNKGGGSRILPAIVSPAQDSRACLDRIKRCLTKPSSLLRWLLLRNPGEKRAKFVIRICKDVWENLPVADYYRIGIEAFLAGDVTASKSGIIKNDQLLMARWISAGYLDKVMNGESGFYELFEARFGSSLESVLAIYNLETHRNKHPSAMSSGPDLQEYIDAKKNVTPDIEDLKTSCASYIPATDWSRSNIDRNKQAYIMSGNPSLLVTYDWGLSRKALNKRKHAENGNTTVAGDEILNSQIGNLLITNVKDMSAKPEISKAETYVEGDKPFDVRAAIVNVSGAAASFAPPLNFSARSTTLSTTYVDASVAGANRQLVASVSSAETPFAMPNRMRPASGGASFNRTKGLPWLFLGETISPGYKFSLSGSAVDAFRLSAENRIRPWTNNAAGFRVNDVVTSLNAYAVAQGESPLERSTATARANVQISSCMILPYFRLMQHVALRAFDSPLAAMSCQGWISGLDSNATQSTLAGNAIGGVKYSPSAILGENLGGSGVAATNQPFYAYGQEFNVPATGNLGVIAGSGSFAIITDETGLSAENLDMIIPVPFSLINKDAGVPGKTIKKLIDMFGPGGFIATGKVSTGDLVGASPEITEIVHRVGLIQSKGYSQIIFLVISRVGSNPPTTVAQANAASNFTYTSGPIATTSLPANTLLQASPITGLEWYSAAEFSASWEGSVNQQEYHTFARTMADAFNNYKDLEMATHLLYALVPGLKPLSIVTDAATIGLAAVPDDYASYDSLVYDGTRATYSGVGGYPRTEPLLYDYLIPSVNLLWVNNVLIGNLVPEPIGSPADLILFGTAGGPFIHDAMRYCNRQLRGAFDLFYMNFDKPTSMLNCIIETLSNAQPAGVNEYLNNAIDNYDVLRAKAKTMYISSGANSPFCAAFAPQMEAIMGEIMGVSVPKDAFANSIFSYKNRPIGLIPSTYNGNAEVLTGYVGFLASELGLANCRGYTHFWLPRQLTDLELYSVASKIPVRMQSWPQPYTGAAVGIMPESGEVNYLNSPTGNYQSLPFVNTNLSVQANQQDLNTPDICVWALRFLRSCLATRNFLYLKYTDGSDLIAQDGRAFGLGGGGALTFKVTRQIARADITGPGNVLIDKAIYQASHVVPTITIAGKRLVYWTDTNAVTIINGWFAQRIPLNAVTLLFNRTAISVNPIPGKQMFRPWKLKVSESATQVLASKTEEISGSKKAEPQTIPSSTGVVVNNNITLGKTETPIM